MNPMADQLGQLAASDPEVFLLYEGGEVADELKNTLTHVRISPKVREIPNHAFRCCDKLVGVQFNDGLQVIGEHAFQDCTSLRSVTLPSTVTKLEWQAFTDCNNLIDVELNEGLNSIGVNVFRDCKSLRIVTLPSTITKLGSSAFTCCESLTNVQLNEGLQLIGDGAFRQCTALRSVTLPSTVMQVGHCAFSHCHNLAEVRFNEGLQTIGEVAFEGCTSLRSVTIPSTVTELGYGAFWHCSTLSDVILLGGERLLNQEFLARGSFSEEQGLLNQGAIDEMLLVEDEDEFVCFAFHGCPLTALKISISWAVSERIAWLPSKCRVSVEERIRNLPCLELLQDGSVLACFPVVKRARDDEAGDDSDTDDEDDFEFHVQDTNLGTARSLYRVLQLIAYHELKVSSILIELAMWKSRISRATSVARADCRVAIPDPAKSLIMEYCGFAGFLEPAIEGGYE